MNGIATFKIRPVGQAAMSENGREAGGTWRRAYLGLGLAVALGLMAAALGGMPASAVASLAAVLFLAFALYVAAPRHGMGDRPAPASLPAHAAQTLPEAAREILDYVSDSVLVLDSAGRVLFVNRAAQAVAGLDVAGLDTEKKYITAVLRTPELLEAVSCVTETGETESVAFSIPVPMPRHFEATIARTPEARLLGPLILIQIRDVTAIRRAEDLRADFVANASHELRTPLAAVSGFIDTLRGHARNDAQARDRFLEIMSVEAGRMRRLIDDLLSLTRIELNEHNPPSGAVDVVAVAHSASEALAPLAQAEGVRIVIAPHEVLKAVGDRDELTQVLQNLVHNAIKYGRHNGEVRIGFGRAQGESRREGDGQVFVAIADEGEGIPREAIPRLTERFYRVDVKRSRERGGTGLGLAIVKHILNRHQGRLHIESTPGSGSTFTVFLPAAPIPATS
jgi:two-component system phosphate regulon sensor histidine kinase PhoR